MSYNNELVDSMRPLCNESQDNNELYKLITAGDQVAKDAMIINNYRLVLSIVEKYITGLPQFEHLRDDLVGEGLLGLTVAANAMAENKTIPDSIDPTSFMSRSIRNHLIDYIRKDKSDDIPFEEPSESNESDDDNSNDELEEDILACCSEDEKPVIELWIAGNSERNIANTLGINDTYVHRIIGAVKIRIIAKFGTDKRVIIE
jgi:RNA polymerase sigma factor (sigma-70 family)